MADYPLLYLFTFTASWTVMIQLLWALVGGEFGFRADRINLESSPSSKWLEKCFSLSRTFSESNSWEAPAVCPLRSRKSPPKLKKINMKRYWQGNIFCLESITVTVYGRSIISWLSRVEKTKYNKKTKKWSNICISDKKINFPIVILNAFLWKHTNGE